MAAETNVIVVLAAIIERDGRVLLTRRHAGTHLAGLWEFPGGKCEPGETHETCLRRELDEELGVDATIGAEALTTEHAYPDRTVRLHFRWCVLHGEPAPRLDQEMIWATPSDLLTLEFPEGDRELIGLLTTRRPRG
jgi:8-oxo-dGTP diphosphatase